MCSDLLRYTSPQRKVKEFNLNSNISIQILQMIKLSELLSLLVLYISYEKTRLVLTWYRATDLVYQDFEDLLYSRSAEPVQQHIYSGFFPQGVTWRYWRDMYHMSRERWHCIARTVLGNEIAAKEQWNMYVIILLYFQIEFENMNRYHKCTKYCKLMIKTGIPFTVHLKWHSSQLQNGVTDMCFDHFDKSNYGGLSKTTTKCISNESVLHILEKSCDIWESREAKLAPQDV